MNFTKKAIILHLFLVNVMMSSCKNETKNIPQEEKEIKDADLPKNVLPKMKPLVNETPKLTADFIAEKNRQIDSFYRKNWPNNSMNGGFLVAKNGQIIYEKYEGYANLRDKTPITKDTPIHIASVSK